MYAQCRLLVRDLEYEGRGDSGAMLEEEMAWYPGGMGGLVLS